MVDHHNLPDIEHPHWNPDGGNPYPAVHLPNPANKPRDIDVEAEYPHIFDGTAVDSSFDRDAIITSGPIPHARPALAGLRRAVTDIRINRAQSKIERKSRKHEIARHVGEAIVKGEGYLSPTDPLRPYNLTTKTRAYFMEMVNRRHQYVNRRRTHLGNTYPVIRGSRQTFAPFYDQYKQPLTDARGNFVDLEGKPSATPVTMGNASWGERRGLGKSARHYRRHNRFANVYENSLARLVKGPSRKAGRLVAKRDRLVRKSEALKRASASVPPRTKSGGTRRTRHEARKTPFLDGKLLRFPAKGGYIAVAESFNVPGTRIQWSGHPYTKSASVGGRKRRVILEGAAGDVSYLRGNRLYDMASAFSGGELKYVDIDDESKLIDFDIGERSTLFAKPQKVTQATVRMRHVKDGPGAEDILKGHLNTANDLFDEFDHVIDTF